MVTEFLEAEELFLYSTVLGSVCRETRSMVVARASLASQLQQIALPPLPEELPANHVKRLEELMRQARRGRHTDFRRQAAWYCAWSRFPTVALWMRDGDMLPPKVLEERALDPPAAPEQALIVARQPMHPSLTAFLSTIYMLPH